MASTAHQPAGLRPELRPRPVAGELRVDGVAALGPAVRGLMARLLLEPDATLARLRGVAGDAVAVVRGAAEDLPWFEGAVYLRQLDDLPGLWLPTTVQPHPSGPVLLRALRAHAPEARLPLVALPQGRHLVSLAAAQPLERERLRAWLRTSAGAGAEA